MRLVPLLLLVFWSATAAQAQTPTPRPDPIREEVTITANRIETRISETPASVSTISRTDIEASAAPTLDDVLRQSVGFSIFRRSSSRNANPTTQGVSLRGVGASGASRSGVFFDGVPLNDPFGGWVQWNRVPAVGVETAEVLRGGASSLYGDASLSGAVNVLPRRVNGKFEFTADIFAGSQRTFSGSVFAGTQLGKWTGDVTAAQYQTRGYIPVDEAERGPVDSFAGVRSSSLAARVVRSVGKKSTIFFRPSYFGEVRTNGTGLQTNRTHIVHAYAGGDAAAAARSFTLNWRVFAAEHTYDQIFSAVNTARTVDTLNRVQRVPAQTEGALVNTSLVLGDHTLLAGFEVRRVRGASDEIAIANGLPTSVIGSGGRQVTTGIFAQDFIRIGDRAVISATLRYDRWVNDRGSLATRVLPTNATTVVTPPRRVEDAASPRVSVLYHVSDSFSLYANLSRSFRSPTLNELYRAFRVGNLVTNANQNLRAERANNFEAGARYALKRFSVRAGAFLTTIDDPISNVTLSIAPTLITRQRQNAGATRSAGLEIESELRVRRLQLIAGYQFADSIVTDFPSNLAIVGLLTPQLARHQLTFQARTAVKTWTAAVQGRASSEQFDDDLNQFRLEPYLQIDVYASRRVSDRVEIYAAVENVFNSRYSIGRTPVRTVSSPVNGRIGIRFR